jgi:opacity protein-like surface antigen
MCLWQFHRNSGLSVFALVCVMAIVAASPAFAQDDNLLVSGGYQFSRLSAATDITADHVNVPVGWYFDVAGAVAPMVKLVFDVSGAYKSETETIFGVTADAKVRLYTYGGGVRIGPRVKRSVSPFVQVLGGAATSAVDVSASAGGASFSDSQSDTKPMLQVGGGVNMDVTRRVGIRAGFDYRHIFISDGSDTADICITVGIVVPIR